MVQGCWPPQLCVDPAGGAGAQLLPEEPTQCRTAADSLWLEPGEVSYMCSPVSQCSQTLGLLDFSSFKKLILLESVSLFELQGSSPVVAHTRAGQ